MVPRSAYSSDISFHPCPTRTQTQKHTRTNPETQVNVTTTLNAVDGTALGPYSATDIQLVTPPGGLPRYRRERLDQRSRGWTETRLRSRGAQMTVRRSCRSVSTKPAALSIDDVDPALPWLNGKRDCSRGAQIRSALGCR
jgi:hypothetical protein